MSSQELATQLRDQKRERSQKWYANMTDEQKNSRLESKRKRRKLSKQPEQSNTEPLSLQPATSRLLEESPVHISELTRGNRKRRSEMSPEQLERRRQYARDRYAKMKERANAIKSTNEEPVVAEGAKQRTYTKRTIEKSNYIARDGNNKPMEYYLGKMEHECQHCGALHFETEKNYLKQFGSCCKSGKVSPKPMTPYPEPLLSWLSKDNESSRHFRANIRKYNSAFAFASFSYTPSPKTPRGGPKTFVIHGQVCI